ncbi:HU family DNA-binding protein [Mycoplasma sp. 744]|uniref:HU family DNA-binding protein n=1 Tax=Mycoplasma sp. 744 TaxID=3108531 RepID=UPI002B1DDCF9|nr:HU family DNA-binding protein [Mycoplasma sp. 744]MEA4115307.1 HU family DNA-binding protein [Mycoplasma sp. 744]
MTKKEFILEVAKQMNVTAKEADKFFDAFVFVLKEQLIAEEKIQLSDLGTFDTKVRRSRETINPFSENKDKILVPEKRVVKFTPSKYLREIVNF